MLHFFGIGLAECVNRAGKLNGCGFKSISFSLFIAPIAFWECEFNGKETCLKKRR